MADLKIFLFRNAALSSVEIFSIKQKGYNNFLSSKYLPEMGAE